MKKLTSNISPLILCVCSLLWFTAQPADAGNSYWDVNGATPGTGGPSPIGYWEDPNWTTDSTGSSATTTWTDGDFPIFAAGSDATAPFVVIVGSNPTIAGMQMLSPCTNVVITGSGTLNIADGLQGFFPNGASLGGSGLWLNLPLSGTGGLINQNGSFLYLYGNNTYSGGTLFTANHIVYYNNDNSFGTGPITNSASGGLSILTTNSLALSPNLHNDFWITNAGGVFNFGAGNTTCSGHWYLQSGVQLKNNGSSSTVLTLSGPISETNGVFGLTLQCPNSGKLVLSGPNTFSGKTSIGTGAGAGNTTVSVSSFNSVNGGTPLLASSSLGSPTNIANGTINLGDLTFASTMIYTGSGETSDRVINLSSTTGGPTIDQSGSGLLKFTSAFTATGIGSKTLTLQGSTASSGEIDGAIVNNPTTGTTVTTAAFNSGATTITLASVDGLTNGAPISGTGIPAGDTVKSINTGTKVVTLNAAANGAGTAGETITSVPLVNITSLTKAQAGTWVLGGANTYSGTTTVSAGTLRQGAANVIPYGTGKGNLAGSAGAVLDLNGFDCQLNGFGTSLGTVDNLSGSGTYTLTVGNANAGGTHNGVIANTSGTIQLNKVGTGTITLNGASTYSGGTTLSSGTLAITNDTGLGAAPAGFVANQLVLDTANNNGATSYSLRIQTPNAGDVVTLSPNRGIYVTANGGGINVQNARTNVVPGVISGPGAFWACPNDSAGYGVIQLAANNTYQGGTYIGAGTLQLAINNAIPVGSPLTLGWSNQGAGTNTIFDLNGFNQTIGPLASNPGFGVLAHNAIPLFKLTGALTIIQTNNTTYDGTSRGAGGSLTLDATSTGTLALSRTNLYTGPTVINGGTLEVGAANGLASTSVTVASGGRLTLDNAAALASTATLTLVSSPAASAVNLAFSGTQTVGALNFSATSMPKGTYGKIGSGALHENAAFTGNGFLNVTGGGPTPIATSVTTISGTTLSYSAGAGSYFVLLGTNDLTAPLATWQRLATNTSTPGSFTIPAVGSSPQYFYRVESD